MVENYDEMMNEYNHDMAQQKTNALKLINDYENGDLNQAISITQYYELYYAYKTLRIKPTDNTYKTFTNYALERVNEELETNNPSYETYQLAIKLYQEQNNTKLVKQLCNEMIKKFPDIGEVYVIVGDFYKKNLKQPEEAKKYFNKALELEPELEGIINILDNPTPYTDNSKNIMVSIGAIINIIIILYSIIISLD